MPRSDYHRSEYSPPPRRRGGTQVAEYEEVEYKEKRRGNPEPDFMREDHHQSHAGPLVVREDIEETRSRGPARSRHGEEREYRDEEVIIARSGNRERERDRDRDRDRHRGGREVIEEEEIRVHRGERERDRDRHHGEREVIEEEEIRIHKGDRHERRPRERETIEEEIVYRPKRDSRQYAREQVKEEWVYRPREEQPMVAKEVEEWSFAPRRREPSQEREHVTIRERERERQPPPPREYRDESITIRERERERPREFYEEDITIRERERERPPPPRSEFHGEEITIRQRERERPREWVDEQISIHEQERERLPPARDDHYEEIRIRERDREGARGDYREEDITIRERSHDPPRRDDRAGISIHEHSVTRGGVRDDDISIHGGERERLREYRGETIAFRERERDARSRRGSNSSEATTRTRGPRGGDFKEQELIIRREDRDNPHTRNDEIVIRRKERSPSLSSVTRLPSPPAAPAPPPEPIRAPPIHQEIITHHRHIDHGFETYRPPYSAPAPKSRPPSPPAPPSPPRSAYEEIEIHRKGNRNGQRYDDDIIINRRQSSPHQRPAPSVRHRSPSPDARSVVSRRTERGPPLPAPLDEEDYYARKNSERAYIGEAQNGATRDWAIVDVPPGTNRVRMDGVGGASEEVTWQRYNGVRRSRFIPDSGRDRAPEPAPVPEPLLEKRKYVGMKPKTDTMWTEITKDLVIKDAIEKLGYEYEETEYFYYIMEYLRYEDVSRLVSISEDLRARRRDRIRQIEWEQKHPPEAPRSPARPMLAERPWEEERERIVEREWFEKRRPERPPLPPPPPKPPAPGPRIVEKEKVVVIRGS